MESKPKFHPNPNLKLMDQVREVLRYHHYAYRTEQTYCQRILRYIHYFGGKIRSLLPIYDCSTYLILLTKTARIHNLLQNTVT